MFFGVILDWNDIFVWKFENVFFVGDCENIILDIFLSNFGNISLISINLLKTLFLLLTWLTPLTFKIFGSG